MLVELGLTSKTVSDGTPGDKTISEQISANRHTSDSRRRYRNLIVALKEFVTK